MASEKKVLFRSSDGMEFQVEEAVAVMCQTIKTMMEEDGCEPLIFPVLNVDGKTLAKVLEYCKKHADQQVKKKELKKFDEDFLEVDTTDIYLLLTAANFLDVKDLLNSLLEKVAVMVRGKTPEEVRKMFNIENDFTKEEEEELRKKNPWVFE